MTVADLPVARTLGEHAHCYAAAGLDVFPVNPRDKTPLVSQYQATTDPDTISAWWQRWPDALIGHRISPDVVILDIDPRHGGDSTWRALLDAFPARPVTRWHRSGRGDGGGHTWWLRPADKTTITKLDDWARQHGTGHTVPGTNRWISGIDVLHHRHRYTILPPSPHPDTGQPYTWAAQGLRTPVAPMPALLADLLTDNTPPAPPEPPRDPDPDSIADWYSHTHRWDTLLTRHGWTLRAGDGNSDGARWRHPTATSAFSATIRHGCLFVYSPNTPFEPTAPGDAHGYTLFRAMALLDHHGDLQAAARAARVAKDGPPRTPDDYVAWIAGTAPPGDADTHLDPELDEFLNADEPDYDWLVEGLLERNDRVIVTASEGGGKSTLLRQMAVQMASGLHPFTCEPIDPLQVLYIDCENSARQVRRKLRDLRVAAGDDYQPGRLRLRILGHAIDLADPAVEADLAARVDTQAVDVIIIGPLYKLLFDDPVKEMPAKAVADAIDRLRLIRGSAVIIEAHSPYAEGSGKKRPTRPYGASLWSRWPEFGLHLSETGAVTHWRGQREEREWPQVLERSIPWPWAPTQGPAEEDQEWDGPRECSAAIVALLGELGDELSTRQIEDELRARGASYRSETIRAAARIARNEGLIGHRKGPRNSHLWRAESVQEVLDDDF